MNTDNVDTASEQPVALNLITEITEYLRQAGVENPEAWQVGLKAEAHTTNDRNVQRFLINRQWTQILSNLPLEEVIKTREARGCLMNGECEISEYIRKFRQVVIPCAIKLGLLKTKS